ncbi:MAG: alpha/beta fold hydrolase [Verrucomicrobiota bacterium]
MNVIIQNPQGEQLDYAFHGDGENKNRIILIGHGVTGDKDRPWAVALGEALAEAGFNALRFSFSGNGQSQGEFRESTISKEVADLAAVINAVEQAGYQEIGYAGHSMGGGVGVIRAAADSRLKFLISLAGMVHTAKFTQVEFGDQTADQGFMWDEKDCPLSSAFVDDLTQIDSVLPLAAQISIPWLLVHGSEDDVVPIGESREIFNPTRSNQELIELPGCNHVFADEALPAMIQTVTQWMKNL